MSNQTIQNPSQPLVLALGTFDGVHLGHQALVAQAASLAKKLRARLAVFTFTDLPGKLLNRPTARLCSIEEQERLLLRAGADRVDRVEFTPAFASLTPEDFFSFLQERYPLVGLAAGFNYTFGKFGAGSAQTLQELGRERGIAVEIAEPVLFGAEPISSTRIRARISEGDMPGAAALLGRPYTLSGRVVAHRQVGRKLGFPTANIEPGDLLLPLDGVYASTVTLENAAYAAVTNVGTNPTFGQGERTVETYILNEQLSLYTKKISVSLHRRLRAETAFASPQELSEQIGRDVEAAKKLFVSDRKGVYNAKGL